MISSKHSQTSSSDCGVVQGGFGKHFMVQTAAGVVRASQAFSCLVTPLPGDKVALHSADNQLFILAILERQQTVASQTQLSVAGDLLLESSGKVAIKAAGGVQLSSADNVSLVARQLDMAAVDTNIQSVNLNLRGDKLVSHWREVKNISDAWHLLASTATESFKQIFRKVETLDQRQARNSIQQVDETLSIRSHNAVITSRKDLKIDAERIHMG